MQIREWFEILGRQIVAYRTASAFEDCARNKSLKIFKYLMNSHLRLQRLSVALKTFSFFRRDFCMVMIEILFEKTFIIKGIVISFSAMIDLCHFRHDKRFDYFICRL